VAAVRGELDWIVLKCLEKDRARRYASASALADDLERFLRDEPVTARPQTGWYRARKFVRRNRTLVAAVSAIFLALILGVAAAAWQALRAAHERDRAAELALRARETAALLTRVIQSANPEFARGTNPTVREMLDAASRDLESDQTVHPLVAGDAHATFAAAYAALADYARSAAHARRAIAVRTAQLGPRHADTLEATDTLIRALSSMDQDTEAVALCRATLEAARAALGPDHPQSIRLAITFAFVLGEVSGGDRTEVQRWSREGYQRSLAVFGPDDPRSLHASSDYALELMYAGQLDEAERLLRGVLETRRRTLAPDHPLLITSLFNLMAILDRRDNVPAAREIGQQVIETAERVLGTDDPRTAKYVYSVAQLDANMGRLSDAERGARRAFEISGARLGPVHPQTLRCRGFLAATLLAQKRPDDAAPLAQQQYDLCRAEFGPRHEHTIRAITLLYDLAESRGQLAEMRRWAEELRGTSLEATVFEQLRAAESAASAPTSPPP
jgi:tetratricopeptide (TPR) repeat protein